MKTIGIIGGGAAGLCGARHVQEISDMTPVVWEQSSKLGGTWVYTTEIGRDQHGLPIHSSMYKNLKTNLPKEVMAFPDFPFPDGDESFLSHTEVCKYLKSYADHFKLHSHIKFNHHVERVSPVMKQDGPPAWNVTVRNLVSKVSTTTTCDALLVCNGHYSVPRLPEIKDINQFKGRQIHSHDYREPFPYKDCMVVILGAAASGLDICLEVATVAKKVFLSHNHPVNIPSEFPVNVEQVRGVRAATENGFMLSDGSFVEADVILYCTGYEFSFPFLSEECGITVEENIVKPLYKHLIHSAYPSMAFVGIPFQICPFPLFDFQAQQFIAILTGKIKLPSTEVMIAFTNDEMQKKKEKGVARRHYHKFGMNKQMQYMDEIAKDVQCRPFQPVMKKFFTILMIRLLLDFAGFKKYSYKVDSDGKNFREYHHGRAVHTKLDLIGLVTRRVFHLLYIDFFRVTKLVGGIIGRKVKEICKRPFQKTIKVS